MHRHRPTAAFSWLVLVSVIAIGLNLRGPIVAVAPVIDVISHELTMSAAQAGLLTSLPVLCFALCTPLASFVVGRAGPDVAVTLTLAGVMLGTIVRSGGAGSATIVGTVIIGVFVTVGNVVVPVVINRDVPPHRVGIATGAYTAALNVGSTLTTLGTAPLVGWVGWRTALDLWLVLAAAAIIIWVYAVGGRRALGLPALTGAAGSSGVGSPTGVDGTDPLLRPQTPDVPPRLRGIAVLLSLAFAGQAFGYYGLTAWLPQLLAQDAQLSRSLAGASSSLFQLAAVVGALGVPLLAHRIGATRTAMIVGLLWGSVPLGLIFAPGLWAAWAVFGGIAQGGGITIVFMLVVTVTRTGTQARRLSALVQGVGYSLAAASPAVLGAAHDISGAWTLPVAVVGAGVAVFIVCSVWAARRSTMMPASRPVEAPEPALQR
ncbi:MAG: transporter, family, cyanate transporter [Propionibacteriaceae bacterium]|jgi:CP family cyanate transporter-like MFS transporter|nr:hypothetical protein [Propionibacteriaceae bacterium]MDX6320216.1 transporter, family, cyanate transporter [Propionibacteriaceae bacterium]